MKRVFITGPQGVGKTALREKLLREQTGLRIYTTNEPVSLGSEISSDDSPGLVMPLPGDEVWIMSKKGQIHSRRTL